MKYAIQPLDKEKWQGHKVYFSDFADSCYRIEITQEQDAFSVLMRKEPLKERRNIRYPHTLLETDRADVTAWGVVENDDVVAGIQTQVEGQRLYIALLWVNEEYRRQGIAAALINIAKEHAKEQGLRAVFLETWSCNEHAIAFYLSQGFKLIGFDSCANSNEDTEKYHVPLKLGYLLQ